MATLADVARRAGVSAATASRVINASAKPVTDALRDRVMRAVDEDRAHLRMRALAANHEMKRVVRTQAHFRHEQIGAHAFEHANGRIEPVGELNVIAASPQLRHRVERVGAGGDDENLSHRSRHVLCSRGIPIPVEQAMYRAKTCVIPRDRAQYAARAISDLFVEHQD